MEPDRQKLFEDALSTGSPTERVERLRDVVASLVREGSDRELLRQELEALRVKFRDEGRDEAEDDVLEVLDFLTGWSSPHTKI